MTIALLGALYINYGTQPLVAAAFLGVQATVVAIVLQALARLGPKVLTSRLNITISVGAFLALYTGLLPFPAVIILAAVLGALTRSASTENAAPPPPTSWRNSCAPSSSGQALGRADPAYICPWLHLPDRYRAVLFQTCDRDLWRCLCRSRLYGSSRVTGSWLAHHRPDDGRAWPCRNHARPAHPRDAIHWSACGLLCRWLANGSRRESLDAMGHVYPLFLWISPLRLISNASRATTPDRRASGILPPFSASLPI